MNTQFKRATRLAAKARIALAGPAGSGKTYTALSIATALSGRVALIDTEHGSASKYAEFGFDVLELEDFHPDNYIKAIKAAQDSGYEVLVIDSASHEWMGKGGCLELKEFYARKRGGNDWAAWADITPLHNKFIEAIHASGMHIIATFRSKMDYMQTEDKKIKKVGMAPITREGGEYEFDVVGELDLDHNMFVTKSRCTALADKVFQKPGKEFAQMVLAWLNSGEPYEAPKPTGKQLDGGKEEYRAEPPAEDADDDQPDPPAHRGSRSNGQRPYTGEAVMGKIIDFAAAYQEQLGDTPASKSLCQMLAASLDKAFGDRDRRLAVTGFVSGFGSTGDDENGAWQSKVKTYQAKAYLKWLGIPDGGWEPSGPYWQDEAKNLYAYVVQSMEARE